MPLVDAGSALPTVRLRELRGELLRELEELASELRDAADGPTDRRVRTMTARDLVADAVALGRAPGEELDRARLLAEVNLFYDAVVVAAEYFRLFVKPRPYPRRPDPA